MPPVGFEPKISAGERQVVVCDLETSRMGAPYIYDVSHLRVNQTRTVTLCEHFLTCVSQSRINNNFRKTREDYGKTKLQLLRANIAIKEKEIWAELTLRCFILVMR